MSETLYIIDGHSQIYRAYYAPFRDLNAPSGEPTRATYVFCSMLLKFIEDRKPQYLAMAIDGPIEKLHRRKVYSEYKVTRKPIPEDLPVQIERICQIVRAMGAAILQLEGYEADDIMATAVEKFASPQMQIVLISRDKDLDQLVSENVILYDPMKDQSITPAAMEKEKGYRPDKAIEVQTLMGDSIDNIPGIPGVGPKKAAALIAKYGSADAVVSHADELTPKLRENVLGGAERLELTRKLVTLDRHAPIELELDDLKFSPVRGQAVREIFSDLGFKRLLEQIDTVFPPDQPPQESEAQVSVAPRITTTGELICDRIDTPDALKTLAGELKGVKRLAIDTETTGTDPMWAEIVGISLAWKPGKGVYLPIRGPLGSNTLPIEAIRESLGPVLSDVKIEKIAHNLKYDLIILTNADLNLAGEFFDTMIAAHVLDSSRKSFKLDSLALELLDYHCIPIEEVIGSGRNQITMDAAPVETVTRYSAEDAEVALRLSDVLRAQLDEEGLTDLFQNLEIPLLGVLAEMERTGIIVDPAKLKKMQMELSKQADVLRDKIVKLAGREFNVDSPKQLAEVLFRDMQLPVTKRTKTRASTDSSVLETLAVEHELPALVLEYRKLTKLLSTYLGALAERIHPQTGRVHTNFRQAATVTGRLSSSSPNLQNIPIRTEEGRKIRSAFVASKGNVLLSADYSQVELRVLAHFCQDPTLISAFESNQDIHRTVAAEVFSVPPEKVTSQQRARAKTVNFGIVYGQTAYGLSRTLRIPRKDADDFIRRYRKRFPKISEFLKACVAQAKENGYVETVFGRRRRIPEIDSRNPQRRAAAERLAINTVVQGSAADLIKAAMIKIARRISREKRPSHMLLQIHDELLFEVPKDSVEPESDMVVKEMSGAIELRVPLSVEVGVGSNWMAAK